MGRRSHRLDRVVVSGLRLVEEMENCWKFEYPDSVNKYFYAPHSRCSITPNFGREDHYDVEMPRWLAENEGLDRYAEECE